MSTPEDPYAGQPAPEHGQTPQQPVPPQQPAYYDQPTAPYYYGPPAPQNAPSRVAWFAIGAGSMFMLGVVGLFGLFMVAGAFFSDPDFDEGGGSDEEYAYYVDQTSVLKAVEGPCANMRSAARDIDLFADPKEGASDIKGFTLAVKGIVDAIDANDPDLNSKQWRDDWEALGADLDAYAADLIKNGKQAKFSTLSEDEDEPIMARMSYSSEAHCEVPQIIEALDPALSLYWD